MSSNKPNSSSKPSKPAKSAAPAPQQLQTIDPTTLANVAGGRSNTSTTSDDSALYTQLSGILESIQGLASSRQQGFSTSEMLMFMMMLGRQNQQPTTIVTSPGPAPWGGYPPGWIR